MEPALQIWAVMMGYLAIGHTLNLIVHGTEFTGEGLVILFFWPGWLVFKAVQTGYRRLFA